MRTKTDVYTVYKFDELPKEIQDKVIERLYDINVDYDWWEFDCLTGFTAAEIRKHHLTPDESKYNLLTYKHLYFDLDRGSYIQFDDCSFANDETARKFLGVPKSLWDKVTWSFVNAHYGGGSCGTTRLTYETNWDYDGVLTYKQTAILDRAVERFSDKMNECWRMLRDEYEGLMSREAIIDTIEANDYEFTIDGKIAGR